MSTQGTVVPIDFEPVYHSLNTLANAVRAFAEVADDWCEEDLKHALVTLLSDNLTMQLQHHQQVVFKSLNSLNATAA